MPRYKRAEYWAMSASSVIGDPVFGLLAILSVGVILFLARDAMRELLQQRRKRRVRERERQQFWG